jgi:Holliday junction resolvase RusA-like endonuclease
MKTADYTKYERLVLSVLPNIEFSNVSKLCIEFGFSNKASDIDNPLKPILDILQKKYKFNDKDIYELNVKKTIVPKGEEFISILLE